jgi:hypothetical protein
MPSIRKRDEGKNKTVRLFPARPRETTIQLRTFDATEDR